MEEYAMLRLNEKIESLIELFQPVLSGSSTIDVVFSRKSGYIIINFSSPDTPDTCDPVESFQKLADILLNSLKTEIMYAADIHKKLPMQYNDFLEECEKSIGGDMKIFYDNTVSYFTQKIQDIMERN